MTVIGRLLIITGVVLIVAGILFTAGDRIGLGRLPGDFAFRRGNVGCYFPLMTSILLSIVISLLMWIFRK